MPGTGLGLSAKLWFASLPRGSSTVPVRGRHVPHWKFSPLRRLQRQSPAWRHAAYQFNRVARMRTSRRSVHKINPPFHAGPLESPRPDVPLSVRPPSSNKSNRQARWRLKTDVLSSDHPGGDVDRKCHPRPTDGFAFETVDKNLVCGGMVDQNNMARKISLIFARHGAKSLAGCLCAVLRLHDLALIHRIYTPLDGPACRRTPCRK